MYRPIKDASLFLKREIQSKQNPKQKHAVASHWEYGHWLLYHLDVPIVASPFQDQTALETLDLFTSKNRKDAERFWKKHPVTYLVVGYPDTRFFRWLRKRGHDLTDYFDIPKKQNGFIWRHAKLAAKELIMAKLFFAKKDSELEIGFAHWKLIYQSPHPSPYNSDHTALVIYERMLDLNK